MAATMTQTLEPFFDKGKKRDKLKLTFDWVSHTDGSVSGFTTDDGVFILTKITDVLKGKELVGGEVIPGATTPTAAFDVVVNDENGTDLFGAAFANCINSAATTSYPFDGTAYATKIIMGALTPGVTNAGDTKNGKIVLFFE